MISRLKPILFYQSSSSHHPSTVVERRIRYHLRINSQTPLLTLCTEFDDTDWTLELEYLRLMVRKHGIDLLEIQMLRVSAELT
jgi:hypothetical protein